MNPNQPALKRSLRLRDLTLLYIVTTLSIRWVATAAAAGPSALVVWLLALVGFFVPLALSVLALSTRYPEEGGLYIWTREAFGHRTAFLAGWTYWMSNLPYFPGILYFGAGSLLVAFGRRGQELSTSPAWYMGFAVFWLVVIVALNIRGLESGKWLNNICSVGNWLPIVVLVALAASATARFGWHMSFPLASFVPHPSLGNAIFLSTVFFAFSGCETGSLMGDEIHDARRTVPRALLAAGLVITVAYLAGTGALLVAFPEAQRATVLAGADGFMRGTEQLALHVGLGWIIPLMAVLLGVNAVGGAAGYLSATSRLPFVAGIDGYLPASFGRIHPRYGTPWVAIAVYGGAGILTAILGQAGNTVRGAYDLLVSMTVVTTFLPFLLVFAGLIRLVRRGAVTELPLPGGPRLSRGLTIVCAAVGFGSTAMTICLSLVPPPGDPHPGRTLAKVLFSTGVILIAGLAVFSAGRRRTSPAVESTS